MKSSFAKILINIPWIAQKHDLDKLIKTEISGFYK